MEHIKENMMNMIIAPVPIIRTLLMLLLHMLEDLPELVLIIFQTVMQLETLLQKELKFSIMVHLLEDLSGM